MLERLILPDGIGVSGLEADGGDVFLCGGGASGKVRVVRRPRRVEAAASPSTGSDTRALSADRPDADGASLPPG